MARNLIAIDFETYLISKESLSPKPVCLSFADGTTQGLLLGSEMEPFLFKLLSGDYTIIAHNATFELLVIYKHFPALRELVWKALNEKRIACTQLLAVLHSNIAKKQSFSFDLASLVKAELDIDISESKKDPDAWRLRYSELDGVPRHAWPKEAIDYAIQDSVYAYQIYDLLAHRHYFKLSSHVKASFALNLMAQNGMRVDPSRVALLRSEVEAHLKPSYDKLIDLGFVQVTKKGKYTKKKKLFDEYLMSVVPKDDWEYTPKKNFSTSGFSLMNYAAKHKIDAIQTWLNVMEYEKILSAFVTRLETADPYIFTQYKAIVSSGRTSSSASTFYPSVNIQQMPREVRDVTYDIRNCFIPRTGYRICSIDYSGLELAATAHQLKAKYGRGKMADLLNSGTEPTDMHSILAARIMALKEKRVVTYDEFVANKKQDKYKAYRQLAKPINLGFPGGIGYDTMHKLLAKEGIFLHTSELHRSNNATEIRILRNHLVKQGYKYIRITRLSFTEYAIIFDELMKVKHELFKLYPDLAHFLSEGHKDGLTGETKMMKDEWGEWVEEPMYRFNTQGVERDWCTYTAYCNGYLMQTPSAVGAKAALAAVVEAFRNDDRVIPLAFIHDEIVFEIKDCPEQYELIEQVANIMIDEMQKILYTVRIAVEAEVFPYWKKSGGDYTKTFFKDARGKP